MSTTSFGKRLRKKDSGRTSATSSQRSGDWQDSVRSNFTIPRNSRTYDLLSSPRMSFAEGSTTAPPLKASQSGLDTSNDWGYFVDCDQQFDEIPTMTINKIDTIVIPEGSLESQEGTIFEL